jgi:hypothetical protein
LFASIRNAIRHKRPELIEAATEQLTLGIHPKQADLTVDIQNFSAIKLSSMSAHTSQLAFKWPGHSIQALASTVSESKTLFPASIIQQLLHYEYFLLSSGRPCPENASGPCDGL